MITIKPEKLTKDNFAPYGEVIEATGEVKIINQGNVKKWNNWVSGLSGEDHFFKFKIWMSYKNKLIISIKKIYFIKSRIGTKRGVIKKLNWGENKNEKSIQSPV